MNAILDRLAPYKLLFEILIIGALASGVLYGVHQFLEHERQIGRDEVQALWNKQAAADKEAAALREKDWRDRYTDAINQGAKNAQALQAAANAAAASSGSLRDTISTLRDRLPGATAEASRAYASTLATVLADCEGRYRAMGQAAQGHADDAATLSAAWPANPATR